MAISFVLNNQRIAFYSERAIGDWKAPDWLRFFFDILVGEGLWDTQKVQDINILGNKEKELSK